jgi:hypothetical protein
MDAERCADCAIAHALPEHDEDISAKLLLVRIAKITLS